MSTQKTAIDKIAAELKDFKGDNKATAVSKFVASTLTHFCEQNERFAEVVGRTPRTLSECCAEIMKGVGSSVSDIDVYRSAVKHYFPDSEVHMTMTIEVGAAPTEEEINRAAKVKPTGTRKPQKEETPKNDTGPKAAPTPKAEKPKPEKPKKETIQLSFF